jgi:ABC-type Zn uptake system ZnuABC Zn-binding protein ZnuA
LRGKDYQGRKLIDLLGGWLGKGMAFRGAKIVTYHKNWIYFTELFGLRVVDYVEPKPGIPPSARHVKELIETIDREGIKVLLAASYFDARQVESIADRTRSTAVIVPLGPGGPEAPDYLALVDLWVDRLAAAFAG